MCFTNHCEKPERRIRLGCHATECAYILSPFDGAANKHDPTACGPTQNLFGQRDWRFRQNRAGHIRQKLKDAPRTSRRIGGYSIRVEKTQTPEMAIPKIPLSTCVFCAKGYEAQATPRYR